MFERKKTTTKVLGRARKSVENSVEELIIPAPLPLEP